MPLVSSKEEAAQNRIHELKFTARMNIFYHERLESYYNKFINFTSFFSVVLSSMAFAALTELIPATIISKEVLIAIIAFLIALLNGAVLAFGMQAQAIIYSDLKKKWHNILTDINLMSAQEKFDLDIIEKKMSDMHASEPPPNKRIVDMAFKKATIALGLEDSSTNHIVNELLKKIGLLQKKPERG